MDGMKERYSIKNIKIFVQLSYPQLLLLVWLTVSSAVPTRVWAGFPSLTVFAYSVLGAAYLVTPVIALRHYVKTRNFSRKLLPLPFLLLSATLFLLEYLGGPATHQYLTSILVTLFYALPMVLVSLVFSAAIGRRDEKRKTGTN